MLVIFCHVINNHIWGITPKNVRISILNVPSISIEIEKLSIGQPLFNRSW